MRKNKYRFSGAFKDACAAFKKELIAIAMSRGGVEIDEGHVCVLAVRPMLCIDAPAWFSDEVERNMDEYKHLILAFMKYCECGELRWIPGLFAEHKFERGFEISYEELCNRNLIFGEFAQR